MTSCTDLDPFFDGELTAEQAATFRDHLASCERCQSVLHGRMQEHSIILADAGDASHADQTAAPPPRRPPLVVYIGPAIAAAALAVWLLLPERPKPFDLAFTIEHGDSKARGTAAHVGDRARPIVRGDRYRVIWVYIDENQLVLACPGSSSCRISDDETAAMVELSARGHYEIVGLGADAPLPAPPRTLDQAVDAAMRAGADVKRQKIETDSSAQAPMSCEALNFRRAPVPPLAWRAATD